MILPILPAEPMPKPEAQGYSGWEKSAHWPHGTRFYFTKRTVQKGWGDSLGGDGRVPRPSPSQGGDPGGDLQLPQAS